MRLLILDNYDSFTYNLHHYLVPMVDQVDVFRNDAIALDEVAAYDAVVLSPGPGLPKEAGIMMDLIERYVETKPILGVCLGHQALCEYFGGQLLNLPEVYHGRVSQCHIKDREGLFQGIPTPFTIGHYHSWVIDPETSGKGIQVTAINEFGWMMAMRHEQHPCCGVQFHPESVMTEYGKELLRNWVEQAALNVKR
ncbi:anthranilate synthase component II [Sanyastnella coralliicola]|uniref:anthranilate synthase component II n=1 Tax=Sanyastnella coralliicola TaxID=3069118 RepID=UPI0027BAC604|nr:aminodeoxychorismate/anthranilate synthase component II [Longitalea sp. SCSIO 12813]